METTTRLRALVSITGRVSVDQDEIDAMLEYGEDEDGNKVTTQDQAFEALARQKVCADLRCSENFDSNEVVIDTKYFH